MTNSIVAKLRQIKLRDTSFYHVNLFQVLKSNHESEQFIDKTDSEIYAALYDTKPVRVTFDLFNSTADNYS